MANTWEAEKCRSQKYNFAAVLVIHHVLADQRTEQIVVIGNFVELHDGNSCQGSQCHCSLLDSVWLLDDFLNGLCVRACVCVSERMYQTGNKG